MPKRQKILQKKAKTKGMVLRMVLPQGENIFVQLRVANAVLSSLFNPFRTIPYNSVRRVWGVITLWWDGVRRKVWAFFISTIARKLIFGGFRNKKQFWKWFWWWNKKSFSQKSRFLGCLWENCFFKSKTLRGKRKWNCVTVAVQSQEWYWKWMDEIFYLTRIVSSIIRT